MTTILTFILKWGMRALAPVARATGRRLPGPLPTDPADMPDDMLDLHHKLYGAALMEIDRLKAIDAARPITLKLLKALSAKIGRLRAANDKLGFWMSAAIEDPQVCDEMKADIRNWFAAQSEWDQDAIDNEMFRDHTDK